MREFSAEQTCAAYLADPLRVPRSELPWSRCDAQALLAVLQRNKVPLVALTAAAGSEGLLRNAVFQSARQCEQATWEGQRAEYRLAKEALAAEGVADVLLKSAGLAPSFPYRSDNLDVLYRPHDVQRVRDVLCALGYVELRNVEEPLKYLFRKFHAGRSVSAIHVHAHVGWMVSFLDEEALWKRCRQSPDDPLVTCPAPEDALLTTLAHFFYEDKRITLWDVCKVAHCLRQGVDWDEVYRVATWRGWRDGLNTSLLLCAHLERALYGENLAPREVLQAAREALPGWARARLEKRLGRGALEALGSAGAPAGVQEPPLRIPFAFSKAFFYAKLLRDPTRSPARRLKDVVVHTGYGIKLRLRIHSQPAMLVTLSGIDGCGKSTQAQALQTAFETCHLQAQVVWTRGGSSAWLGWFTRRAKRHGPAAQDSAQQPTTAEARIEARKQGFRSPRARWGWSWLTTVELLWQYAWRVAWPLWRGRVVICDRYAYDALADWAAYFDDAAVGKRLAARVLHACSPRPRLAYWLDVAPAEARARSPDGLPLEFLSAQAVAYQHLATRWGLRRLASVDDAGDRLGWEAISDRLVYEVLGAYMADYHTWLNALFWKNPGQWK